MDTQLELKEYFFPVAQVVAAPGADPENESFEFKVDVSLAENNSEDEKIYQVSVDIESIPEGDDLKQPYSFHLVVIGLFTVNPNHPDIGKLLYINGSSILFGAAREFLITITSRGPWPAISLPSVSFLKKYHEEVEALAEGFTEGNEDNEGDT